ncbi:MAG: preprotein translocase subunit YajC [Corynebacterium sp.]|nr:preprotein translocase subunit YajC [Corynebacterium sp.]
MFLLVCVGVFAALMFFQMRRQQQRIKEIQQAQAGVGVGDKIVLTCGLHGEVIEAEDSTIVVEIAAGVYTRWDRQAIMTVKAKAAEAAAEEPQAPNVEEERD